MSDPLLIEHVQTDPPRLVLSDGSRWHVDVGRHYQFFQRWAAGERVELETGAAGPYTHRLTNIDHTGAQVTLPARRVQGEQPE